MTFNGKAKATSQFFYNLKQDDPSDIDEKVKKTIRDYFIWYSNFQNKDVITNVEMVSSDFKCSTGCVLNSSHRLNTIDILIAKEKLAEIIASEGKRAQIQTLVKL